MRTVRNTIMCDFYTLRAETRVRILVILTGVVIFRTTPGEADSSVVIYSSTGVCTFSPRSLSDPGPPFRVVELVRSLAPAYRPQIDFIATCTRNDTDLFLYSRLLFFFFYPGKITVNTIKQIALKRDFRRIGVRYLVVLIVPLDSRSDVAKHSRSSIIPTLKLTQKRFRLLTGKVFENALFLSR